MVSPLLSSACFLGLASLAASLASPHASASDLQKIAPPCNAVNASQIPCIYGSNCSVRQKGESCLLQLSIPSTEKEVIQETSHLPSPSNLEKWGLGTLSVAVISLSGVFGAFLWPIMNTDFYQHVMRGLVGLAVGSLTATALFQLIPEGFRLKEIDQDMTYLPTAIFSWFSIWIIFVIEGLSKILFKHDHAEDHHQIRYDDGINGSAAKELAEGNNLLTDKADISKVTKAKPKVAAVAWMVIFGDGIHNFIDGMTIGAGFSYNVSTGLGMSLAIICEEFPHELGDFAILVQSGMSIKKALGYNFLSACTAFLGLVLGIVLGQLDGSHYIFAFAGGLFLYISLTHLIPEMQGQLKEELAKSRKKASLAFLIQNLGILLGSIILFIITKYNDDITMSL